MAACTLCGWDVSGRTICPKCGTGTGQSAALESQPTLSRSTLSAIGSVLGCLGVIMIVVAIIAVVYAIRIMNVLSG